MLPKASFICAIPRMVVQRPTGFTGPTSLSTSLPEVAANQVRRCLRVAQRALRAQHGQSSSHVLFFGPLLSLSNRYTFRDYIRQCVARRVRKHLLHSHSSDCLCLHQIHCGKFCQAKHRLRNPTCFVLLQSLSAPRSNLPLFSCCPCSKLTFLIVLRSFSCVCSYSAFSAASKGSRVLASFSSMILWFSSVSISIKRYNVRSSDSVSHGVLQTFTR